MSRVQIGSPDPDEPCRPRADRCRSWTARPTPHKGIMMRSGLEARSAETLDRYGLPWQYEPRSFFEGTPRQYTPDFLVHGLSEWYVEIKPRSIDGLQARKARDRLLSILDEVPTARLCLWIPERHVMRIYVPTRPEQRRWKHIPDTVALEDEARAAARQKINKLVSAYGHCVRQPTPVVHGATLEAEMSS